MGILPRSIRFVLLYVTYRPTESFVCPQLSIARGSDKLNFSPSLTLLRLRQTRKKNGQIEVEGEATNPIEEPACIADMDSRRSFLKASMIALASARLYGRPSSSNAYDNTYPETLDFSNSNVDLKAYRKSKIMDEYPTRNFSMKSYNLQINPVEDVVWGLALWFLSGSRSNPFVTPLANLLYDSEEEPWLRDRNEGLFSPLPVALTALLALLFVVIGGVVADNSVELLGGFDSLQLAGVSLIGGGALELGRLDAGLKASSRDEADRESRLRGEFVEFAEKRLKPGGNCHRSEVVRSFRRFYAKYRQADSDNPEYALSDLEIERLLRDWNRSMGNEDMSSVGFFTGIQLDDASNVLLM